MRTGWLILFLTLLTFEYSQAKEPTPQIEQEEMLTEAYIRFQFKEGRGDSFYRVWVDQEERPYLDIENILSRWLEMLPICDYQKKRCDVTLHIRRTSFRIDGSRGELGIDKEGNSPIKLPENTLIVRDKKLWLRYDLWPQWLPVSTKWNLNEYQLNLLPDFPLLQEVAEQRQKNRERIFKRQKRRSLLKKLSPLTPTQNFSTDFRYLLSHEQYSGDEQKNTTLTYDLNSDIWQGTLLINGNLTKQTQNEAEETRHTIYWKYSRLNQPWFHLLEVGDTFVESSLLVPTLRISEGVKIHRLKQTQGVGQVHFYGTAPKGTEIDLFRSGFLIRSHVVEDEGVYNFDNIQAAGGERVKLSFYYPDGSLHEESLTVASDGGQILSPGVWDYHIHSGNREPGKVFHFNTRYGLFNDFTIGGQQYRIEDESTPISIASILLAWRPAPGIYFMGESANSEQGTETAGTMNFTLFHPHFLQLKFRKLQERSPLLTLFSGDEKSTEYRHLRHSLNSSKWLWSSEVTENMNQQKVRSNIRYHFTRYLDAFLEPEYVKNFNSKDAQKTKIGCEWALRNHQFMIQRTTGDYSITTLSYRFQGQRKYNWDLLASYTKPDESESSYLLTATWRPTKKVITRVRKQKEKHSAMISLGGSWANSRGFSTRNEFGKGTLTGVIQVPENFKNQGLLEGIVIWAGSKKGVTDQNGRYTITNLPIEQRLEVYIETNSLDVGWFPKDEVEIVKFRPGTWIEYNPELIRTVGIDGIVQHHQEIPEGVTIQASRLPDRQKTITAEVEEDGFFLLEGLLPGSWILELKGVENPPPAKKVVITEEMDWIPEMLISWPH